MHGTDWDYVVIANPQKSTHLLEKKRQREVGRSEKPSYDTKMVKSVWKLCTEKSANTYATIIEWFDIRMIDFYTARVLLMWVDQHLTKT